MGLGCGPYLGSTHPKYMSVTLRRLPNCGAALFYTPSFPTPLPPTTNLPSATQANLAVLL